MFDDIIYLDNNATTQVDKRVLTQILPYYTTYYGNPSGRYKFGKYVQMKVEEQRANVAKLINAGTSSEIIFTSGATESINLGLKGIANAYRKFGQHIIAIGTEHKAVLETLSYLSSTGFRVTYLNVNKDGDIDLEELQNVATDDTILVVAMLVNNETGIIHPIKDISKITSRLPNAFLFCDATAAIGKLEVDVQKLGVDLLVFSGHKMYAPKGVGCLYVGALKHEKKVNITTQIHGGGQELGIRNGTPNIPALIGIGEACKIINKNIIEEIERIRKLRDYLENGLINSVGAIINSGENRVCNVSNLYIEGIDNAMFILKLNKTIISSGSACSNDEKLLSHVLLEQGFKKNRITSSVRISLGRFNTQKDIDFALQELIDSIRKKRT